LLTVFVPTAVFRHRLLAAWHLESAKADIASMRLEDAKRSLRAGLTQDPEHLAASLHLSRVLQLQGRLNEALRLLRFVEQLEDSEEVVRRERRLIVARLGGFAEDDGVLRELLGHTDLDRRVIYDAFVSGYCTFRQFDDALRLLHEWGRQWPDDFRVAAYRGDIDRNEMRWSSAIEHYERAIEQGDIRAQTWLNCIECMIADGRLDNADQRLRQFITEDSDSADAWYLLAQIHTERGDFESAREAVEASLEAEPFSFRSSLLKSQILIQLELYDEAVSVLDSVLLHWPEDVAALREYERSLSGLGRTDEAAAIRARFQEAQRALDEIEVLKEQLSGDRGNIALHQRIGELLMEHVSRSDAIPHLAMVLRISPNNRSAHELMQRYYASTGQTDLSMMHFLAGEHIRRFFIEDEVRQR